VQPRGSRTGRTLITALVAAVAVSACGGTAIEASASADPGRDGTDVAGTPDPQDWDAVLAAAHGSTLDLHMWGGSTEINRFVDEVYGPPLAELGVTLNRVPLADTADAVNAVLGQLEAGRTEGGSVDLIWINGENFATMRQADALLDGWAELLPNAALVDWDDPSIAFDAGLPVEGAESPWGSAQFQFVYDSARTDASDLPRTYAELADWIVANPGRFTYPAPPAFHGTRFVKQWFYELSGGAEPWLDEVDSTDVEAAAVELWRLLGELRPHLWRGGETYPADIADLDRLFANGEVDLTFTQLPAGIGANIDAGVLPPTARPYVFDTGTIGDHHYLAIPRNAADAAAAMVFADLVLGPGLQAAKLDPTRGWGDGLAISVDRLDPEQVTAIEGVVTELGPTAVDQAELEAVRLPETRSGVTSTLERGWDRHVRQRQPVDG
jgi:putative spermidine/putrescine transport system substrate-binding protein